MTVVEEDLDVEEVDPFRPTSLDEFIGQEKLKARLKVHMDAALAQGASLDHVLLATYPGFGKTALTHLICQYLDEPMYTLDISSMTPAQFASAMRRFSGGVILFDEVHRGTRKQLEGLLTLLEEGYIASPAGYPIEVEDLTVVLATTEPEKLPEALKDRCMVTPEFVDYTDEELTKIVIQMGEHIDLMIPEDIAIGLGRACAGTPRYGKKMVKAYHALTYQPGEPTLDDVLDLVQVTKDGLTSKHIEYLVTLEKMDALAGEDRLCKMLRVSPAALSNLERVLFKREMVAPTPRGRALLAAGDAIVRKGRRRRHG